MEILRTHPELEALGFRNLNQVYWQLHTPQLYEQAVRRQEAFIAHLGPLVVHTGDHTGRSPKDRFIVQEPATENSIWWGATNRPFTPQQFDSLLNKALAYFQGKNLFVQNCHAGVGDNRINIRVITETAWHNLFVRNMFRRIDAQDSTEFQPQLTVLHAPNFHADPDQDGTNSSAFIVLNFSQGLILIGGTNYAGELKKAVFTALNYILPQRGVLPVHCSANEDEEGEVALFFGLTGTGKTTLASDSTRIFIGDDEHGWSEDGIFNLENGSYARALRLSRTDEPEIYGTTRRFGTILENVLMNMDNRRIDLEDGTVSHNTRACYPIHYLPNATRSGIGGHPKHIIFLTADAFGVLPAISRLTPQQAIFYFLTGYTGKHESSDLDHGSEPEAMFRACFSEPFLPLPPRVYANMLLEKINQHNISVWMINTVAPGQGTAERLPLEQTRLMVRGILNGDLNEDDFRTDPVFGFEVPTSCPDVPDELLNPQQSWPDEAAYQQAASDLAARFRAAFEPFAGELDAAIKAAGPG